MYRSPDEGSQAIVSSKARVDNDRQPSKALKACGCVLLAIVLFSGFFGVVPLARAVIGADGDNVKAVVQKGVETSPDGASTVAFFNETSRSQGINAFPAATSARLHSRELADRSALVVPELSPVKPTANEGETAKSIERDRDQSVERKPTPLVLKRANGGMGSVVSGVFLQDYGRFVHDADDRSQFAVAELRNSSTQQQRDAVRQTSATLPSLTSPDDGYAGESDSNEDEHTLKLREACRKLSNSVVEIYGKGENDVDEFQGYGFYVIYGNPRIPVIVTCNHVIEGRRNIHFVLPNDKIVMAGELSACRRYDVAVFLMPNEEVLERNQLTPCDVIKTCRKPQMCDEVIALGGSDGLLDSPTFGRINNLNLDYVLLRSLVERQQNKNEPEPMSLFEFVQLDIRMGPGASGGPVFNLDGEVIGMAAARVVEEYRTGFGFMIPINNVLRIVRTMIENNGWVPTTVAGVNSTNFDEFFWDSKVDGFQRKFVYAKKDVSSSLLAGDIICKFAGEDVRNRFHLRRLIEFSLPGSSVQLEIKRKTQTFQIQLKLEKGKLEE